jgi:hypothetical protein
LKNFPLCGQISNQLEVTENKVSRPSDPDFAQIHEPERDISSAPSAIGAESRVHLMRSLADRKVSLVKNLLKANAILKVNSSERCAKMKKAWDVYAPVFEKNFQATAVIAATTKLPSTKYVSEHDVNVTKCEQAWSHHWREPGSMWPFQLHDEQLSESGGKKKQKKTKTKSTKAAAKRPRKSHDPDDDVDDKLLPATATSVDGDDNADDDAGDDDADDGDDGEDDDANGFGQYVDGNTGADADLTIADGQLYLRERERLLSANEKNVKMREEFLVEKFAVEIRGRNIRRRLAQAADLLTDACPYCGDTNVITRPPEARQRHMLRCSKENPIQLATDDDEHKP